MIIESLKSYIICLLDETYKVESFENNNIQWIEINKKIKNVYFWRCTFIHPPHLVPKVNSYKVIGMDYDDPNLLSKIKNTIRNIVKTH